jgi:hypothetical protein
LNQESNHQYLNQESNRLYLNQESNHPVPADRKQVAIPGGLVLEIRLNQDPVAKLEEKTGAKLGPAEEEPGPVVEAEWSS